MASGTVPIDSDWAQQSIALKAEGKESAEIAEAVGKNAASVRKVLAEARRQGLLPDGPVAPPTNGNGNGRAYYDHEAGVIVNPPIPGQTTVDDHLTHYAPVDDVPDDGFRPTDEIIADFKAEAGEPVGDMPPADPEDTDPLMVSRLKGTRQLALDFGENADVPLGGTLVIKSDKLASGFFGLGDVIRGTFEARIVDVAGKERLQRASEEFRAQPQHHVGLITDLTVE